MYDSLFSNLEALGLRTWCDLLRQRVGENSDPQRHSDLVRWQAAVDNLPEVPDKRVDFTAPAVTTCGHPTPQEFSQLRSSLKSMHPWRKGPFDFFGVQIDTEWRSDMKWERVRSHVDLKGKTILDVGCGNGYYGFRMLGEGAKLVCGLDPFLLYWMQFRAIKKLTGENGNFVLPVGDDVLSTELQAFDFVFSMGVLYHRRSPIDHLIDLSRALKPGGELVLETLVVVDGSDVLVPLDRYAKMRNVWFIPSLSLLERLLRRTGFSEVNIVDVTQTTNVEQRRTEWMQFESLPDFLDPENADLTIEGYPAPTRALLIARKS